MELAQCNIQHAKAHLGSSCAKAVQQVLRRCTRHKPCLGQDAVAVSNVHALLRQLAAQPDPLLRRAVLGALCALAANEAAAGSLPKNAREEWAERVSCRV